MFELHSLVDKSFHDIQTLTVEQRWLIVVVDTQVLGSGCGLVLYHLENEETAWSVETNTISFPSMSSTSRHRQPFSYQAKFHKKAIKNIHVLPHHLCEPNSNLNISPPVLLLCLSVDGQLNMFQWVANSKLEQPSEYAGRYEKILIANSFKIFSSISCMSYSYSTTITRALCFASKKDLYPVYWTANSASKLENLQFTSAITLPGSRDSGKIHSVKFPYKIKNVCWPDGGDIIYVNSPKEYYCLFLCKETTEICTILKSQGETLLPTCSHFISVIDKKEWTLMAFYIDDTAHIRTKQNLTKTGDEYMLEPKWNGTPLWISLQRAVLLVGFFDEVLKQFAIEIRLAVGSQRGYLLNKFVVDVEKLEHIVINQRTSNSKYDRNMIILHNTNSIWFLARRDPWDIITQLLKEKMYSVALTVCEFMAEEDMKSEKINHIRENDSISEDIDENSNVLLKIKRIRTLQAIDDFKEKREYVLAVSNFIDLDVECSNVLRFICPCLMGGRRQTSDILNQLKTNVDPTAINEIIVFLVERRVKLLSRLSKEQESINSSVIYNELQIIDNALLRCYAVYRVQMITVLVRSLNYCDCTEAVILLKLINRDDDLITMYKQKGRHREALKIYKDKTKDPCDLCKILIQYFRTIIFTHLELVLEELSTISPRYTKDHMCDTKGTLCNYDNECIQLFTEGEQVNQLNPLRILDFIKKYTCNVCQSIVMYLEIVIFKWLDCNERIHTELALAYIERAKLDESILDGNIKKLLDWPNCKCDLKILLPALNVYPNERAFVLFRLKRYKQAFTIWIEELGMANKAVDLAINFDKSDDCANCVIEVLLSSKVQIKHLQHNSPVDFALELLNGPLGRRICPAVVLENVSDDIPLSRLHMFLKNALINTLSDRQDNKMKRSIYSARKNKLQKYKSELEKVTILIEEDSVCCHCKRRLDNSAIARYPDGNIAHLGCVNENTDK